MNPLFLEAADTPNTPDIHTGGSGFKDREPLKRLEVHIHPYKYRQITREDKLGIKDYRNEKIDICFRRECENMIDELKVTPLSDSNKDECLIPSNDVEFLLHRDPSTPMISVVSILEGFTDEPPLKENEDLFDLKSKMNEWKKILYDDLIDGLIFDPGGDVDEIDAFLDIDIQTIIKDGFYDSGGDVLYLESLLSDDTTPSPPPEVYLDCDPRSLSDIDNLKNIVKVLNPEIHETSFSPTYVFVHAFTKNLSSILSLARGICGKCRVARGAGGIDLLWEGGDGCVGFRAGVGLILD
ncbi:hypothetical protein Tco_0086813 [Tanacetum coccineum]